MMMLRINSLFSSRTVGPPPPAGPFDPVSLFTTGIKGGYWEFTDPALMAVNSDGTGGQPALDSAVRHLQDKGPNDQDLRNTVGTATRRSNGIEMPAGVNYGLFNFAPGTASGNWVAVPAPYEVIAVVTPIAWAAQNRRVIGSAGAFGLLEGSVSGTMAWYDGIVSPDFATPLGTEVCASYQTGFGYRINGGALVTFERAGAQIDNLMVGSDTAGTTSHSKFRKLLCIGRHLTDTERSNTITAMMAA